MRRWKSKKHWLEYGKERDYDKLKRKELQKKDSGYHSTGLRYGWLDDLIPKKIKINWENKKEWLSYGLKGGYNKLIRSKLQKKDRRYYIIGLNCGWLDDLIPESMYRRWKIKKTWLKYGIEKGYDKLSRSELGEKDAGYYSAGWRRDWLADLIPEKKHREWENKKHWLEYGIERGYNKLGRGKLSKKDIAYYSAGWRRDWLADLIPKRLRTTKEIANFIQKDERARAVTGLALENGYLTEAAQILADLWPTRFPSFEKLVKELPRIVPGLGPAITPLSFPEITERIFKEIDTIPQETSRDLHGIFYRIGIEEYQKDFNTNPQKVIKGLKELKKGAANPQATKIFSDILKFYQEAQKFEIPGYGNLKKMFV